MYLVMVLQELSISDWTQDELDALYRHWKLACPSVEELRERWRQGRNEKVETDRRVEEGESATHPKQCRRISLALGTPPVVCSCCDRFALTWF